MTCNEYKREKQKHRLICTNLRIKRSKHQNASASSSRSIIMGEQRSLIPGQHYHKVQTAELILYCKRHKRKN